MAKKEKNSQIQLMLGIVIFGMTLVGITLFLVGQVASWETILKIKTSCTGVQVTFGNKDKGLAFNFIPLLALIIALAGGVLVLIWRHPVGYILSSLLLLASGIMLFLVLYYVKYQGIIITETLKKLEAKLGYGAIVGGSLMLAGGLLSGLKAVIGFTKK